jgi:multicomponent Na+:H+ antiporter subunit D
MIADHLPVLQVVVPLLSGPAIVLVRRRQIAWGIATLATWMALATAIAIALRVADSGTISYAIGSWPAPWGIEYRIDRLNAFMLVLVSTIGAVAMPYARISIAAELPQERQYLFYAMYCLCLTGLLGIAATGDAFNLFVFLEISSLSTYVLIALGRRREALWAAYQYLVMGTIGATFYVIISACCTG